MIYLNICLTVALGMGTELSDSRLMNGRPNRQAAAAEDEHTFVASDYYGDCTKSLLEVTIVLLTQSALLIFYVLGLYTGEAPDFSNGRVFAFYYAGSRVCTRPLPYRIVHSQYVPACTCTRRRHAHAHALHMHITRAHHTCMHITVHTHI